MGTINFMCPIPESHNKSHAHPVFQCFQTWKSFIIAFQNQAFHAEFISNPTTIFIYKANQYPYKGNALMNEDLCKTRAKGGSRIHFKSSVELLARHRFAIRVRLLRSGLTVRATNSLNPVQHSIKSTQSNAFKLIYIKHKS